MIRRSVKDGKLHTVRKDNEERERERESHCIHKEISTYFAQSFKIIE